MQYKQYSEFQQGKKKELSLTKFMHSAFPILECWQAKGRVSARHILHLIWLDVAKIDLFIGVNKIILGPVYLLITSEHHQISKTAQFKWVCLHNNSTTLGSDSI